MAWTILISLIISSILAVAADTAPLSPDCKHTKTEFRCVKFIKNYDADTVTFNIPDVHPLIGENISVRVSGIDTPEIKGKNECEKSAARTAQRLIENLLKNARVVHLKNVDRDKYFRILADVEVDGKLLKDVLFKNKLAYEYHGETKAKVDWCKFTRQPASWKGSDD